MCLYVGECFRLLVCFRRLFVSVCILLCRWFMSGQGLVSFDILFQCLLVFPRYMFLEFCVYVYVALTFCGSVSCLILVVLCSV